MLGANATYYNDNTIVEEGDYYYQLVAYYKDLDCYSAPAAYKYNPDQYYLHFYYSVTGTNESQDGVRVYPIPTKGMLKIEAQGMSYVSVCNLLGQVVYEKRLSADECSIDMKEFGNGMFVVKIETAEGFITKKISVIE